MSNRFMFFLFTLLVWIPGLQSAPTDSLTITEVMFDPSGSETTDEFIEVYNYSKTLTYDLSNWIISDSAGGNDSDKVIGTTEGTLLYPGQFAIIFDTDYSISSGLYRNIIPDTARILKIQGTTFGSGGLNNSASETVMLIKTFPRDTIARYRYSLGNTEGFSDEKINLVNDDAPNNWTNSIFLLGTPGAPPETDLSIKSSPLQFNPLSPPTGNSVQISANIKNIGIYNVETFKIKFYEDLNANYSADPSEAIDSVTSETLLNRGDSAIVSITTNPLSAGKHIYMAQIVGDSTLPSMDTVLANNVIIDSLETIPAFDVAVVPMNFSPLVPVAGGSLQINVPIKNLGVNAINGFTANLYEDLNKNLIADIDELKNTENYSGNFASGDSTIISFSVLNVTLGKHYYIVEIPINSLNPSPDEKATNNSRRDSIVVSAAPGSIVVNEFLYNAISGEIPEWVELFNRTDNDISLQSWKIGDSSSVIMLTNKADSLRAGHYAVIIQDSTSFHQHYGTLDNAIKRIYLSGLPSLNNGGDVVKIITPTGITIDSVRFRSGWGGGVGISLERRLADSASNSVTNWKSTTAIIGGTPGTENTATPASYDLSISAADITFSPGFPIFGQVFTIFSKVHNVGLLASENFSVNVFRIAGADTTILLQQNVVLLAAGDSLITMINDTAQAGRIIFVRIDYNADQRAQNNSASHSLLIGTRRSSIIINEINYVPGTGATEWIELYNPGPDTIDLKKWTIADGNSDQTNFATKITITNPSSPIYPGEYVVVGKDSNQFNLKFPNVSKKLFISSFPTLNNSGDMIGLFDSVGAVIDSLMYESKWGGSTDVSLERISAAGNSYSSANWHSSINPFGATPGKINSVTPVPLDIALFKKDITFSPAHPAVGEPVSIHALIRNIGLQPITASFTVTAFYDGNNNNLPETTEEISHQSFNNLAENDSMVITFAWTTPGVSGVSPQIFVVIDFTDDQRIENNSAFQNLSFGVQSFSVVINEFLYEPDSTQSEFVEIYNRSDEILNLRNWKIGDASGQKTIVTNDYWLFPQSFRILTSDTAFHSKFQKKSLPKNAAIPDSLIIVIPSMPSLNNTDDAVYLADSVGVVVDSVYYFSSWGGRKGISIERIDIGGLSNDPGNWTTCVAAQGSTPGQLNSILSATPFPEHSLIINEIMFSSFSDEPEYIELYNPGDSAISLSNWVLQINDDKMLITQSSVSVAPKAYIVIAQNKTFSDRFDLNTDRIIVPSSWKTLQNTGARIILRDWIGSAIDSVDYLASWGGGEGIALEKINPTANASQAVNWGSCVFIEGGTPGEVNSIFAGGQQPKKIKLSATPNPFFIDRNEETKIIIELPVTQARVTLKIYDHQGRHIRTLLNNAPTGVYREVSWDGKDQQNRFVRMGIYVMYLEVIDEITGFNKNAKKTVVVGRKL
ncbi:lamin tail domain-containing protein [bacterium]|nr:lamin tail domain-containing protein [bacterium]